VARSGFYAVLCALAVRLDFGGGARQANANGAMSTIARDLAGRVVIGLAAAGFLAFGLVRLVGAVRDRRASRRQRGLTGLQGAFYVGVAWVPTSFLVGRRSTGTEGAQHAETARLLTWPGGRELVIAIGVAVVLACGWQLRTAATQDFTTGLRLRGRPRWLRRAVVTAGTVGIAARAAVFLPIGGFLIAASVQFDPAHARGLDAELATLARSSWWGPALLALVAAGLAVFAVYSGLEAWLREVAAGR
jgi:hypothetical protein